MSFVAYATHNRAGEITYRQLSNLTYEVTFTTYTKSDAPADRPEFEVSWGDGNKEVLTRANGDGEMIDVVKKVKKNVYIGVHTYPGIGHYVISLEDPNRNADVKNIPYSVEVPFYIETHLLMNPFVGGNNSPKFLNPPIDDACINQPFIHNPGLFDAEGDSLVYSLIDCRGKNGEPIPGYKLPAATKSVTINSKTGDFVWDSPMGEGEYNVAIQIEEYRKGILIGKMIRDMQILVGTCQNDIQPEITTIKDTCIEAGQTLKFDATATDVDNNILKFSATGGPFEVANPATFPIKTNYPPITSTFEWKTNCNNVRKQPYFVHFRAEEADVKFAKSSQHEGPAVNIIDLATVSITVVAPAPKNLTLTNQGLSDLQLAWQPSICSNAVGYKIYKKNSFYGYVPQNCQTGVPAYTGYQLIKTIDNINSTTFLDKNLQAGIAHCYMVVAYFADGAESYASQEICGEVKQTIPLITNVSVVNTNNTTGSIEIKWTKPKDIDPLTTPGPYEYVLYRSLVQDNNFIPIYTTSNLNDTIFTDINLNTQNQDYKYKVEFHNKTINNEFLIGTSLIANSIFTKLAPGDKKLTLSWTNVVPWQNDTFFVFKQNPDLSFSQIASTVKTTWVDKNLENGKTYCYYIISKGKYSANSMKNYWLLNNSQIVCAEPYDNEPTCPPVLSIESNCENEQFKLVWTNPNKTCATDGVAYKIYFKKDNLQTFSLLTSINSITDTTYVISQENLLDACFAVTAIDHNNNESIFSNELCLFNCPIYELPNVFTPNADGINDKFVPIKKRGIVAVKINIYNRWGALVYQTDDIAINWNGTNQTTNQQSADGVYFYTGKAFYNSNEGQKNIELQGLIHLINR